MDWLINFLKDTKMYANINYVNSDLYDFNIGVPQESVLGPLMLNVNRQHTYNNLNIIFVFGVNALLVISANTFKNCLNKAVSIHRGDPSYSKIYCSSGRSCACLFSADCRLSNL